MPDFKDIKDQIQFTGFTEEQQASLLKDLERVYGTESGQAMMDKGLAGEGLHYLNSNSQAVLQDFATATQEDPRFQNSTASELHGNNFAITESAHPRTLSGGQVYINEFDAIDPETGKPEVYTDPAFKDLSPLAADASPINSVDADGKIFEVDPFYILVHETNHAAADERDINGNNSAAGQYYTPSLIDASRESVIQAYQGLNESSTQEIMRELDITQLRGSYLGTSLEGQQPGEDYGLGRDHDVGVTSSNFIDMSNHTAVDAVVLDGITQDLLDKFNASSRTDLLDQTFRVGNGNDTVHAFDGDDIVVTGAGNDNVFLGSGDDVVLAGWGKNTLDGGDANLVPASNHLSDTSKDWGIDAVNYTTLDTGFAAPNALQADATFDGVGRDGVLISVDADSLSVTKGQENAVRMGEDVDVLNNIDSVTGTDRDDLTVVSGLSGDLAVDGADGKDTLLIDGLPDGTTVTNTPGAVTFNGASYDGVVSDGTNNLYYTNFEDINLPKVEADAIDKHIEANSPEPVVMPLDNAARILHEEGPDAAQQEAESGVINGPIDRSVNTPVGRSVIDTLAANGETEFSVSAEAMAGDAQSRVGEVMRGAMERVQDIDKIEEVEARFEDHLAANEVQTPQVEAESEYEMAAGY